MKTASSMTRLLAILVTVTGASARAGTGASALTGGMLHNAKSAPYDEQIAMMRDVDMSTTAASALLEGSDSKATAVAVTGGGDVQQVMCASMILLVLRAFCQRCAGVQQHGGKS